MSDGELVGTPQTHRTWRHGISDAFYDELVRGLVCVRCNNLLGYLEKTPDPTLRAAFSYLAGGNPRGYLGRRLDPPRLA